MRTITLVVAVICCVSCNDSRLNSEIVADKVSLMAPPSQMSPPENESAVYSVVEEAPSFSPSGSIDFSNQKLIRKAYLSFDVKSLSSTYDSIKKIISQFHAYAANEQQMSSTGQLEQQLDIRVDAKSFDVMIDRILVNAKKIRSKSISVIDVTDEFTDISARLRTKKEIEKRYYDILRQARTVKDMISIEEQLGTVREEIESTEARFNVMSKQIAYSTIHVEFSEPVVIVSQPKPGFASKAIASFNQGWSSLVGFVLGIVSIWPLLTVCALVIVMVIRFLRRKRREDQLTGSV